MDTHPSESSSPQGEAAPLLLPTLPLPRAPPHGLEELPQGQSLLKSVLINSAAKMLRTNSTDVPMSSYSAIPGEDFEGDDEEPLLQSHRSGSVHDSGTIDLGCYDDNEDLPEGKRGILESMTRSVAESFHRGFEPPVLASVVEESPEVRELDLGKGRYVIMLMCAYMTFVANGFAGGLGVLYVPLLSEFNTTSAEAALVQSLADGVLYGGGIISGMAVGKLGPGPAILLGSVLATSGCLASAFALSVSTLIVTVGIITGAGCSLILMSGWAAIGLLSGALPRYTPSVLGLTTAVGALVFPYFNSTMMDLFGWRGVYILLGGCLLNAAPGGLLLYFTVRRVTRHRAKGRGPKPPEQRGLLAAMHLHLFKQWRYLLYAFSIVPFYITAMAPTFFVVDIANGLGLGLQTSSMTLIVLGATNVLGRVFAPFLEKLNINGLQQSAMFSVMSGVAAIGFALARDQASLLGVCAVFGLMFGPVATSVPLCVLEELKGQDCYSAAVGYAYGVNGIGDALSGPLGGLIRDYTGSYDIVFYAAVGTGLLAGVIHFLLACSCRGRRPHVTPAPRRSMMVSHSVQVTSSPMLGRRGLKARLSRTFFKRRYDAVQGGPH